MRHYLVRVAAAATLLPLAGSALAHDGHALTASHWHSSDVWGFVVVLAGAALAAWLGRGGR